MITPAFSDRYTVWCDGSVVGNGTPEGVGGYGYVVFRNGLPMCLGGGWTKPPSTNNTSELWAAMVPLAFLSKEHSATHVEFVSDSKYVVKSANEWLDGWLHVGKEFPNKAQWLRFKEIKSRYEFAVGCHIRGHQPNGPWQNHLADHIADYCLKNRTFVLNAVDVADIVTEYESVEPGRYNRAGAKLKKFLWGRLDELVGQ
jgi:ribonuclease HI